MGEGFIFNDQLCVNCKACKAACILENGWKESPREIYTFNPLAYSNLPVLHLSLSCNHCLHPACMTGCPAGAFSREPVSGAVLINDHKCLGCSYCTWNCPYDAPKPVTGEGIIEKCNLCQFRLGEGLEPACTSACPTGALKYGPIPKDNLKYKPDWFPDKELGPLLYFSNTPGKAKPGISPEPSNEFALPLSENGRERKTPDLSLIFFTFFVTCSVANICSSLINGAHSNPVITLGSLAIAALSSFFHLGKKFRAFRAVINIKTSPLSREIFMLLFYATAAVLSFVSASAGLILTASISGLILLITIDAVYFFSDRSPGLKFNSGQTFLSGLLIASLFSNTLVPFLFIACIKLAASARVIVRDDRERALFNLRFIRITFLFIPGVGLAAGIADFTPVVYGLVLIGEFLDRVIFYYDFKPDNVNLNIREFIRKHP